MKKKIIIALLSVLLLAADTLPARAQSQEVQQLLLNIEKLKQLKEILDNMYKGYKILSTGYNTIKDLAEGNFDLHKVFLDGLLQVSSTVRNYKRVAEIISMQQQVIKEYKAANHRYQSLQLFNPDELEYISKVYSGLVNRTLKNLDELIMVITAGELRMNDAERLAAIDRIYADMQDKLQFLRYFNNKTSILAAQRQKNLQDIEDLLRLYGIKN
jgi:hypothetical protein